jgi:hypothetical protein
MLTVAQVDFTQGAELVRREAKHEKNRSGSTLPIRADLADELRQWIAERQFGPASLLFTVPAGLRRILDRDLRPAGIRYATNAVGRLTFTHSEPHSERCSRRPEWLLVVIGIESRSTSAPKTGPR